MKELAKKSGAGQLKLWGKIKGTESDYYIAEGKLEAAEAGDGEGGDAGP